MPIDWNKVEVDQKPRRRYRQATCPECGRTISEGAYSGIDGNLRKHVRSHLKPEQGHASITK